MGFSPVVIMRLKKNYFAITTTVYVASIASSVTFKCRLVNIKNAYSESPFSVIINYVIIVYCSFDMIT